MKFINYVSIMNPKILCFIFIQNYGLISCLVTNKILGTPQVVCTQDGVLFEMETQNPFAGQLYVKNEFENPKCRANFKQLDRKPGALFKLSFNECSMRRQRMVKPKGLVYSVTMMVQFHGVFVTDGDKAFQIRCFYQEMDAGNVTSALDVSPLTTTLMDATHSLPSCTYSIRMKALDGPKASLVKVGDTVVHMFKCDESGFNLYRLLIKDCYVDDGKQNRHKIIGSDGCTADPDIMQTPTYVDGKLEAIAEASVFKWPDEPSVFFQCQISLCMQESETCQFVTPPRCSKGPKRRSLFNESDSENKIEFDLEVKKITVMDIGQDLDSSYRHVITSPNNLTIEKSLLESNLNPTLFFNATRFASESCFGVETLFVFGMIFFIIFILLVASICKLFVPFCHDQKPTEIDSFVYSDKIDRRNFATPNMYYVDYSTVNRSDMYKKL